MTSKPAVKPAVNLAIKIVQCFTSPPTDLAIKNQLPYILAYKSQNLRQNLDLKVGGATYTWVIK